LPIIPTATSNHHHHRRRLPLLTCLNPHRAAVPTVASPWSLPRSTLKPAQHSLNTTLKERSEERLPTQPTELPPRHRLYSSPSPSPSLLDAPAPSPARSPPPPSFAEPQLLDVVLRPSASLLRQTPAVLPFFTLDGLRRLPPRYATARHSLPVLLISSFTPPPSLPTACLHRCIMSRTAEPSRVLALR
jgi:hypothetical protein